MKAIDLTGRVFEHLTVLKRVDNIHGRVAWLCQCDCGNQSVVRGKDLRNGHAISCGHLKTDRNHNIAPGYENKRVNGIAVFLLNDKRKIRTDNTTGVTGVKVHHKRDGSIDYQATITIAGKRHFIGNFPTVDEARLARKKAESELLPHG